MWSRPHRLQIEITFFVFNALCLSNGIKKEHHPRSLPPDTHTHAHTHAHTHTRICACTYTHTRTLCTRANAHAHAHSQAQTASPALPLATHPRTYLTHTSDCESHKGLGCWVPIQTPGARTRVGVCMCVRFGLGYFRWLKYWLGVFGGFFVREPCLWVCATNGCFLISSNT